MSPGGLQIGCQSMSYVMSCAWTRAYNRGIALPICAVIKLEWAVIKCKVGSITCRVNSSYTPGQLISLSYTKKKSFLTINVVT